MFFFAIRKAKCKNVCRCSVMVSFKHQKRRKTMALVLLAYDLKDTYPASLSGGLCRCFGKSSEKRNAATMPLQICCEIGFGHFKYRYCKSWNLRSFGSFFVFCDCHICEYDCSSASICIKELFHVLLALIILQMRVLGPGRTRWARWELFTCLGKALFLHPSSPTMASKD